MMVTEYLTQEQLDHLHKLCDANESCPPQLVRLLLADRGEWVNRAQEAANDKVLGGDEVTPE